MTDAASGPLPRTSADLRDLLRAAPAPDATALEAALARNTQLTKPPGALGRLEDLATWYCSWRRDPRARVEAPQVVVFAGNHGVTAQGVSAFPPEVTAQMVANFAAGGAAINQLAGLAGARLDVHALDLDRPTEDFTTGPAMDEAAFATALAAGWEAVDPRADLLVTGEMGIGNTTAAAAIAHGLFGGTVGEWTGRGTGVDDAGLAAKTRAVAAGIAANGAALSDPLEVLRCLGGREIVAMAAAIARARCLGIPVILDGFICTAAAACLHQAVPGALDHAVAGHVSAEHGHSNLLERLGKAPLLTLGMRLGEGSGAALAIQVLKGALACHSGMATFAEAGVAEG
ncbi:nicotinate-nucleotide--dimethylbenzimidazole phosphoribosyltransferase [Roseibacterium sp. SDUM158016]|uniref:nicotinate-nucleotide--dimethylbenzimidazole phosphoribosyltransferase n=1 Tax=Roseicyclus sediminis TaxID=2980997 RepID=UPI0021CEC75F|nr:nicotinate-nucleotide--dimethylbenzimidazole phosphoribosyltransferase [Roseibacterium sp. SDUM158016]MCU4653651.1 nicotinate-nucleotide--dimethylbenzimidazole phosphoribosyltransferase [Roseibacterium sp. SDUM158016]